MAYAHFLSKSQILRNTNKATMARYRPFCSAAAVLTSAQVFVLLLLGASHWFEDSRSSLVAAGPPICDASTPLYHKCWEQQCPQMLQVLDQFCGHGFDHLFRLYATNSCFNADFSEKLCCGYELDLAVRGKNGEKLPITTAVVNPSCFVGNDVFAALSPEVCCEPKTAAPRLLDPDLPMNIPGAADCRDAQNVPIRVTMTRFLQERCTDSEAAYNVVQFLDEMKRKTDENNKIGTKMDPNSRASSTSAAASLAQPGTLYSADGAILQTEADFSLGASVDLFRNAGEHRAITWVEGVQHRHPLFGLQLQRLKIAIEDGGRMLKQREIMLSDEASEKGDSEEDSEVEDHDDITELADPTDLLLADKGKVGAYLQVAIKTFRSNDTSTWLSLVDMAEKEYRRLETNRKITTTEVADGEDHEAPQGRPHLAAPKIIQEQKQELRIFRALDHLWSLYDAPFRWRDVDYKRSETWSMLFRAAEKLEEIVEEKTKDSEEGSFHLAKIFTTITSDKHDSVLAGAAGTGSLDEVHDQDASSTTTTGVLAVAGAQPGTSSDQLIDTRTREAVPAYAVPFLQFRDDFVLYKDAARCGHLRGIMEELKRNEVPPPVISSDLFLDKSTGKLVKDKEETGEVTSSSASSSRKTGTKTRLETGFVVLDVGAGTAPCEPDWRNTAPGKVFYLKQDFGMYDTSLDADERGKQIHKKAHQQGLSPFAYASSIHNKQGYSELDVTSDITAIPLPSNSIDVIVCDQVLEHLPKPIAAIQEIHRLLKPGGKFFLSHPYGSFLHNLPYHYNGGFTHSWFETHFLQKDVGRAGDDTRQEDAVLDGSETSSGDTTRSSANKFSHLWWNYRYEKQGQALQRVLNDVDCLQVHLDNFADKRIYRELLLRIVPQFLDSLPALCPGGSERKPQAVHVVAVK
ncbi:unnamed protein product [Amoebophrya sp. A120]|nr:unnamed protein product [Amoebophrya sp. A120]|eukprot:GSA120T00017686001.1